MADRRSRLVGLAMLLCAAPASAGERLMPLKLALPDPFLHGDPIRFPPDEIRPHLDQRTRRSGYKHPKVLAPKGTRVVSAGKLVTSSCKGHPVIGELEMVTDGDKRGVDGNYVELGPGKQWVQIDLGKSHAIYAILVWHYPFTNPAYYDVTVQVADDADLILGVKTLYNSDFDNSSGLGIGKDKMYYESHHGRLILGKGVKARYVRLYSNGNTDDQLNHYLEVEVWGK